MHVYILFMQLAHVLAGAISYCLFYLPTCI